MVSKNISNKYKYTVIIPFYNGEKFINKYFKQILGQSIKPEKIIFINDGNNNIKEKNIKKFSKNILYLDNMVNKGVNFSVIKALNYVDTEFLKITSIDDIFLKDHFYNSLKYMIHDKEIMMTFTNPGHYIVNIKEYVDYDLRLSNKSKFFYPEYFKNIYSNKTFKIFSNTIVFRSKILNQFKFCFDDNLSKYADQILNTLIAVNYKTLFLPEVDTYWSIHKDQNVKNYRPNIIKIINYLEKEKEIYLEQLIEISFFYDLSFRDLIKILLFKSRIIKLRLIIKFIKFYLWKIFKNLLPTSLLKKIVYFFS